MNNITVISTKLGKIVIKIYSYEQDPTMDHLSVIYPQKLTFLNTIKNNELYGYFRVLLFRILIFIIGTVFRCKYKKQKIETDIKIDLYI